MLNHSDQNTEAFIQQSTDGVGGSSSDILKFQLIVWTAPDEKALGRVVQAYQTYYSTKVLQDPDRSFRIRRLAYTLGARRSHMAWRAFMVLSSGVSTPHDSLHASPSHRTSSNAQIGFIFTGQGAQYVSMGHELVQYPVFNDVLKHADHIYQSLGSTWSLIGETSSLEYCLLHILIKLSDKLRNCEDINRPEYSQPLCTALQLALLELLSSFGIQPKVVIGHSSGEIAAA
jgi:acyl transferase domain-containing protein